MIDVEQVFDQSTVRDRHGQPIDCDQAVHQGRAGRAERAWVAREQARRVRDDQAFVGAGEASDEEVQPTHELVQLHDSVATGCGLGRKRNQIVGVTKVEQTARRSGRSSELSRSLEVQALPPQRLRGGVGTTVSADQGVEAILHTSRVLVSTHHLAEGIKGHLVLLGPDAIQRRTAAGQTGPPAAPAT